MEYKIIVEEFINFDVEDLKDLEVQVNEAIKEGWRPQGGITFHFDDNLTEAAYQAMVKE